MYPYGVTINGGPGDIFMYPYDHGGSETPGRIVLVYIFLANLRSFSENKSPGQERCIEYMCTIQWFTVNIN